MKKLIFLVTLLASVVAHATFTINAPKYVVTYADGTDVPDVTHSNSLQKAMEKIQSLPKGVEYSIRLDGFKMMVEEDEAIETDSEPDACGEGFTGFEPNCTPVEPEPEPAPSPTPVPAPEPSPTPALDELYLSSLYAEATNRAKLEAVVGALPATLVQSVDTRVEALTDAQEVEFVSLSLLTLITSPMPTSVTEVEVLGGKILSDLEMAEVPTPSPTPTPTPTPTPSPTPPHDMGNMPHVDVSLNAPRGQGSNTLDIKKATNTPDATASGGQFRIQCNFSHMANNDPIVFPGQAGASHHHTFFGNTSVNADSDLMGLSNTGNSTCHGGIANRSAYWVPSLIDTSTGKPLKPKWALFYYKTGNPATVTVPPKGLRMIVGDATATSSQWPAPWTKQPIRWLCNGDYENTVSPHIMSSCNGELDMFIQFLECWDGVNLDSADHKSHMAYPNGNSCPTSHPVRIPTVTMNVHYPVNNTNNLRLASDNYLGGPGGYSLHGDWVNGWDEPTMSRIVNNCLKRGVDCHANLLGQGQELYNKFSVHEQGTVREPLQ